MLGRLNLACSHFSLSLCDVQWLHGLKQQFAYVQARRPLGKVENLDTDDFVVRVEIQDNPRRCLLGLGNGRVVEKEVQGIGLLVYLEFHSLFFIVRDSIMFFRWHARLSPSWRETDSPNAASIPSWMVW